jgi:MSHA biogenesis protein MshL
MKRLLLAMAIVALAGCTAPPPRPVGVDPAIRAEMDKAVGERKPDARPEAVEEAVLPPLRMEMPEVRGQPIDPRFDLSVSNAPAAQVFMSIVSGTRYSMLLHPGVSGNISVNLKDVTIQEALDSIRELYGYDYKVEGTRIFIQPAGLQTRVFQVNYLPGQRRSMSNIRVQSGAVTDTAPAAATAAPLGGGAQAAAAAGQAPAAAPRALDASRITTQLDTDFWTDLRAALTAIVGTGEGRSVVVTPHSGVIVVRALPPELRAVEQYLRATRLAIERQVMLEAKIVEVTLSDAYLSGINWAAFRNSGPNIAVGQTGTALGNTPTTLGSRGQTISGGPFTVDTAGRTIVGQGVQGLALGHPAGAVFGLAFQASNFAALLQFLESQGNVQVLSSPRIATLNNQKAILKVGTDEFFVTNVTTTTTTAAGATTASPTVTVQPFFSGVALDVTPQIDETNNIILHLHPSVSEVTESVRVVNVGGTIAEVRLPLAKSTVSETDTIVRVQDGNIVAIGGLMSVDIKDSRGGIPGVSEGGLGDLLRNTNRTVRKKELVILLKPTIIQSDRNWEQDLRETRGRLESLGTPPAGVTPAK